MKKSHLLSAAAVCLVATCLVGLLIAQTSQPTVKIPANGDSNGANAQAALKASTRHGEWVEIAMPGSTTKLKSWVVYPERRDKAPVVIVIFEIFGMSDWIRAVTDQLAADGFIAIAPDLLSGMGTNGGGTEAVANVNAAVQGISADERVKRLDAVREYGLSLPSASQKVGCIGFCWGGATSFTYASRQSKLNAAVVYYGSPATKDEMAKIECPILGCYGGNDNRITSTVEATKASMAELKKSYEPHVYEGAGHGFLRQHNSPANIKASQEAWPTTIAFLKKNLS